MADDPEMTLAFEDLRDGVFQAMVVGGYGDPVRWTRAPAPAASPA